MTEAFLNPQMLVWARHRAQVSDFSLAEKLGVKLERVVAWEGGERKPSFKQAHELARLLHVPLGYLFLGTPPQDKLPIPDLRTLQDRPNGMPSPDLRDVVTDIVRKQAWYRQHLIDQGASPLPFVGRFARNRAIGRIAAHITATLDLKLEQRSTVSNWDGYLDTLMASAERVGVTIMRNGVVGNNTTRRLSVDEFRGLVISDTIAPVVFINGADAKAAQIFTLVHELAHLWIDESGITDSNVGITGGHKATETLCNAVAAEVLVPAVDLAPRWKDALDVNANTEALARVFKVSPVVIGRRALELGLIQSHVFASFYAAQVARWREQKDARAGGGDFYATIPLRNGRKLTSAVVHAALGDAMLLRDAGALLHVQPGKLARLAAQMGLA